MADTDADVRLYHAIHLKVGDLRKRPVNVFEKCVSREFRRTDKVGKVQLVLIKRVYLNSLTDISKQTYVAEQVKYYVRFVTLTMEGLPHVQGVSVVCL